MTLTEEQLNAAVRYNASRSLDKATVERVQRVVGAKVDGKLGPRTAAAVAVFQASAGLAKDGKIGPKTLAAINATQTNTSDVRVGLWVDDAPSVVLTDAYFEALADIDVSTVAVLVHRTTAGSETTWRPRWSAMQLAALRQRTTAQGIEIVLTTWPLPSRSMVASFASELPAMLSASGAVGLEVDTEGNWQDSRLDGYADLTEAANALLETLRSLAQPNGARLELTTFPYHPENSDKATLAPHMDRLFPQAYSVANRRNGAVAWTDPQGPRRLQDLTASRARSIPGVGDGRPRLAMGLAAYDQTFAGHTVAQAMSVALDAARSQQVTEVRYWSSKWVVGAMRGDGDASQFLLDRAGRKAEMPSFDIMSAQQSHMDFAPTDADDDMLTTELEELRAEEME